MMADPGARGEGLVEGEGVAHGVQHVHPGQVEAVDRWADRHRPGRDDESVVAELTVGAGRVGDADLLGRGVDRLGAVVEQQLQPGRSRSALVRWARSRQSGTSPDR